MRRLWEVPADALSVSVSLASCAMSVNEGQRRVGRVGQLTLPSSVLVADEKMKRILPSDMVRMCSCGGCGLSGWISGG